VHREFKTILLLAVTTFSLFASPLLSLAENPQVTVSVYDDAQLPSSTLVRAEQQASRTFTRVGLNVTWLDCTHINGDTEACNEINEPVHLVLRITPIVSNSTSDTAFGVAYLATDGTGRYGDVFWQRVQELHTNSNVDMGIVLGSVMAHEMGHLLLGSNAHAISGIMRAHWEGSELRHINMGTLLFLPEQGQRMRARIAQQRTFKSKVPDV
jgi:hypothetical protein